MHALQENSLSLLEALYMEKKLAVTRAMLDVQQGYYPSVESILNTLKRYESDNLVIEFQKEHRELIDTAKNDIQNSTSVNQECNQEDDFFSDIFNHPRISSFETLKSVSLREIEAALSETLTQLCGESLQVGIRSFLPGKDSWTPDADIEMNIKQGPVSDSEQ